MFQNAFSPANIVQYRGKQEDLAEALVKQIFQKPNQWRPLLTRFASSIVLSVAYGVKITDDNDPFLVLAEKIAWYFANGGSPGSTLVDILPFIRRLPWWVRVSPSLNFARDNYPIIRKFHEAPFAAAKNPMASGVSEISFVRKMLEDMQLGTGDESGITEDDIKGAAGTMYAAGADTTLSTLVVWVLCMVLNPEVQEKARQEIDRVVGRDHLPKLSDRGKLPIIDRMVYETSRCVDRAILFMFS
jgi:cytochrome P450